MIRIKLIFLCVVLAMLAASAQAQSIAWGVAGPADFSDPTNWDNVTTWVNPATPTVHSPIVIDGPLTAFPSPIIRAFIINGGTALLQDTAPPGTIGNVADTNGIGIGSDMTNDDNTGYSGTFTQNGQTLTINGEFQIANNGGTGTYNIQAGTLNVQNWFSIGRCWGGSPGNGVGGAIGLFNMTGGTVNRLNNAPGDFDIGERGTGTQGTLSMSNNAVFWNNAGRTIIGAGDYAGNGGGTGIMNISGNAVYHHADVGEHFIVGYNGCSGTLNVNGGTVDISALNSALDIGNGGAGTTGIVNLNAGTLQVIGINIGVGTSTGTLNFNGGTLKALQHNTSFLPQTTGTGYAYVLENGAKIYTDYNITIAQPLDHGGVAEIDGGLFKTGSGILKLAGWNTYTGPTTVNQGTLLVNYRLDPGSTVTVKSGATLGGNPSYAVGPTIVEAGGMVAPGDSATNGEIGTLAATSLSLTSAQLNYEFDSSNGGWDKIDLLSAGGALTAAGTNTFNITALTPGSLSAGIIPLITFNSLVGGLGNFALSSPTLGSFSASLQLQANEIDLKLVSASIEWAGVSGANWNINTNWNPNTAYPNGTDAIAKFGTLGSGGTVNIPIPITVGTIIFDNYSNPYTLSTTNRTLTLDVSSGNAAINIAAGSHTIDMPVILKDNVVISVDNGSDTLTIKKAISQSSGTYGLTKQGSGTLVLSGTNSSYAGATIINGGVIEASYLAAGLSNSSIGASPADAANLVFNTGALRYTGSTVAIDRGYTMNGDATIEIPLSANTLTLSGQVQVGVGMVAHFTKTGSGTLTYTNSGTNTLGIGASAADVVYGVQNGGVVMNGGAGSVYNLYNGDMIVSGATGGNTSLTLASGTTLNAGGDFIVADASSVAGPSASLSISGTLNVPNTGTFVLANGAGTTATATIGPGAQVNLTIGCDGRIANNGGNATLTMTGGTFNCNSWFAIARHWDLAQPTGTIGVFNFSGGTFTKAGGGDFDVCERGDGNQGTLNMSGDAVLNMSTGTFRIGSGNAGQGGGNGYVTITGTAQINLLGGNTFNVGDTGTDGSLTMNGGTITLSSGLFNVGTGNAGSTYSQGSLTINTGTLNVNNWIAIGQSGGTGTATMTGGTVNKTGGGGIVLGSIGGTGTWTHNGGTINNNTALILGEHAAGTGTLSGSGTFYLNGGLVQATQVRAGTSWNPGTVIGTFYFNGGTLQATAASTDYMTTAGAGATLAVLVQSKGAVIDTNNFDVTINNILAPDPASPGGGLTKQGSGTLTITQDTTYTGNTTVSVGILDMLNINTPSATVTVEGGGNELTASSIVANTLTIGAGSTVVIKALPGGPMAASSLSPVPEPSTLALLAMAALATLLAAWRKRRQN